MKKKEYIDAINMIVPSKNAKEEIKQNIFYKKQSKKSSFNWKAVAAVVALICAAGISVPVVASGIRSYIISKTPSYAPLSEDIKTSVFSKSDGHIKVDVEELLSDGIIVNMTVKYTSLDDTGKNWLSGFEATNYNLCLRPYLFNTVEYATNYGYSTTELTEHATENERIFLVEIKATGREYCEAKGVFYFPMTETSEETMLDISSNVEIRTIKLTSEEKASDYYTPTCIVLSPMSYVIYAENHGVYERYKDGENYVEKWLIPSEEIDSLEAYSYFIMKDGSTEKLSPGAHNSAFPNEENLNSDVMLYSNQFYDYSESYVGVPKIMNLDDFEAIVINGVRFDFDK